MTAVLEAPFFAPPEHRSAPGDPPKLTSAELAFTHAETLATPRRRYSLAARLLFLTMDLLYGRRGSFSKYRVLEVVARVPYQTWETASYKQITRVHRRTGLATRIWQRVLEFRAQQDNETWHLLVMSELAATSGRKEDPIRYRLLPHLIAFGYWHFCWLFYAIKPGWSHRLNADFEDHAEHEYAEFVHDHPELELQPWSSVVCHDYGRYDTVADLIRQISHDERCHKHESEQHLLEPRIT